MFLLKDITSTYSTLWPSFYQKLAPGVWHCTHCRSFAVVWNLSQQLSDYLIHPGRSKGGETCLQEPYQVHFLLLSHPGQADSHRLSEAIEIACHRTPEATSEASGVMTSYTEESAYWELSGNCGSTLWLKWVALGHLWDTQEENKKNPTAHLKHLSVRLNSCKIKYAFSSYFRHFLNEPVIFERLVTWKYIIYKHNLQIDFLHKSVTFIRK